MPTDTRYRRLRGGGWSYPGAALVRATERIKIAPKNCRRNVGFRTVQQCRQAVKETR